MYSVVALKVGYSDWARPNQQLASGSITLVKGAKNIIVDTGLPTDRTLIRRELKRNDVAPRQIDYVVCTCGQSDHTGNNNLFPHATLIMSYDVSVGDLFTFFPFHCGQIYQIDQGVRVLPTPGHTNHDVSVLVNTKQGVVAITGDLFEREDDLQDPGLWKSFSEFPDTQATSRQLILGLADFIVPGHGAMFAVPGKKPPSKWLDGDELVTRIVADHSADFRSVRWYGSEYSFTTKQACCVEHLWNAWEKGTPELSQAFLLESAGSDGQRLSDIFRRSPAWGKMIVPGKSKGTYRLNPLEL